MTGDSEVGSQCLTQNSQSIIGCKIDRNLTATQSMMSLLDGIDTAEDDYLEGKITQARWFAGVGTAGPAIVAGTMLIMFRIAMALFVGFAPVFILCLLFKKTAPLFQKWLYYGLATIFSGVMLGVMAGIAMDLVTNLGVTDAVSSLTGVILTGQSATGIMQTVTQQLGLGLMLSTLLITVPPMAGMFFNGVMGSFSPYSVFNNSGTVPPSVNGGSSYQQQVEEKVARKSEQIERNYGNQTAGLDNPSNKGWINLPNSVPSIDSVKQQSQMGHASPPISSILQQGGVRKEEIKEDES